MHHDSAAERRVEQFVESIILVQRARRGDRAAFSLLARRYQEMALGYALTLVHDYHLAEDVMQEALLVAYLNLPALHDDARFPSWLRGIVRFQCGRVLRKRGHDLVPLENAHEVASTPIGPEQQLMIKEG